MKLTGDETQRIIEHLTAIRFGLQLLRREAPLPARSARILESTESAANALTELVVEHILTDASPAVDPSQELPHLAQRAGAGRRTRARLLAPLFGTLTFCAWVSTRARALSRRLLRQIGTLPPRPRRPRPDSFRRPTLLPTEVC